MDMVLIAGGLLKATLPKVAGKIAIEVNNKLHPTEQQRAKDAGLQKSGAFDRGQKVNNAVFYRCTDKDADTFLAALLEHPEVQRELQKPLEQDGAPEVAILVQVAKYIADDRTLDISDETLEPWLKTFANAYFDEITAIRFQVAKADYLEQLANWFDDVKFLGVALDRHEETSKQLAQIFVMPDVEEERRTSRASLEFDIRPGEDWKEALKAQSNRQSQLLQEQRLRSQLKRSGRKFSARQLLNQHQKKIVLLGAPGSGKTTLMSFFAVELTERQGTEQQGAIATTNDVNAEGLSLETNALRPETNALRPETNALRPETNALRPETNALRPETIALSSDTKGLSSDTEGLSGSTMALSGNAIELSGDTEGLLPLLIRIRDWARTPDLTIPEYARQFAETTMSCKPLPKGFFEHWLNNGRALILLDGLDEVAEESKRYHLVQCIENFLGQYPLNRAIITSRPAGYKRDFFRTEEFPHYELQPFDDGKIEEFCDRWYRSRVQDTAEAQRRKESLQKALNQQDRIKLLARNPLLLTIIALIHRYQARLPRERYKLYDKAVETLLTAWDDNKELSNQTVLKYLQLDDLRRLMESLAYWIHTQGTTGDTEGGTLIGKDKLIQKLCQEIKTLKQLKQYEAKAEAERFVKFIRDRTGLLNEQGQDCYAFVHKTFQEYLAAQDINYQADNEDDFELVLTHIEQYLHDPHWREVLLLLIAQQSPKKAARAIRKVLTANSPYEQWLHLDLLFAGRCLAEDPKGLQVVDAPLIAQLLEQMVALEISNSELMGDNVQRQVMQILCSLSETAYEAQALSLLRDAADRINENHLRRYQIELGDVEVISSLLASLQDDNATVRATAVITLGIVGNASNVILQGVLNRLEDEASDVRHWAATVLGGLGNASNVVQHGLLDRLQDEDSDVRCNAAAALVNLGNSSDIVLEGLLSLFQDQDCHVRRRTVDALGKLGNTSDVVLKELLNRLQDKDENHHVRSRSAIVLGSLGRSSDDVLQELLSSLQDRNSWVCSSAVAALGNLGNTSKVVLQELLNFLQNENEDSDIRCNAAAALINLGNASDVLLKELLTFLQDEDFFVRSSATTALGKLGKRSNQVEPEIVQWIEQHQDEECVGAGIDALWEIVEGV